MRAAQGGPSARSVGPVRAVGKTPGQLAFQALADGCEVPVCPVKAGRRRASLSLKSKKLLKSGLLLIIIYEVLGVTVTLSLLNRPGRSRERVSVCLFSHAVMKVVFILRADVTAVAVDADGAPSVSVAGLVKPSQLAVGGGARHAGAEGLMILADATPGTAASWNLPAMARGPVSSEGWS